MKRAILIPVVAATLALASPAVAGPALGMTAARMQFLKNAGHLAIDRRLNEIDRLTALTNGARHLTSANRSALLQKLSADRSGLQTLDAKIQADTDATTLRNDLASIVTAYRIYVLVAPQVHLVVASDRVSAFISAASAVADRIQSAIDTAKANGKDVAAAQKALDDMRAQLKSAGSTISGVASSVIALTPGGYPANRSTLLSARDAIVRARGYLEKAREDAHAAVSALG